MDQRSCAVEGCKPVICLQAFVFANPLDVSSDGGGQIAAHVMTMTCTRSLNLSAVVSQVGAMPHVLAFHKTFGGTLMALCTFGPAVIARKRNMCIGDVIAFLQLEFYQRPFHCTDLLGVALDRGDPCPDAVMVLSVSGVSPADFSSS